MAAATAGASSSAIHLQPLQLSSHTAAGAHWQQQAARVFVWGARWQAFKMKGGAAGVKAAAKAPVAKATAAPVKATTSPAKAAAPAKAATTTAAAPAAKAPAAVSDAAAREAAEKKAAEERAAAEKVAAEAAAAAAEEAARAAAAEAAGTGTITLLYDVNRHPLQIVKGRTTAEAIDEETALTFAYPNCEIHLTRMPVRGTDWKTVAWDRLEARDAAGNFSGLVAGKEYYCVVVEDGKEKARYEKEQAARGAKALAAYEARAAAGGGGGGGAPVDRQLSIESCSCIEGNPCQTPECCQDWSGRFENARRIMEEKTKRRAK